MGGEATSAALLNQGRIQGHRKQARLSSQARPWGTLVPLPPSAPGPAFFPGVGSSQPLPHLPSPRSCSRPQERQPSKACPEKGGI